MQMEDHRSRASTSIIVVELVRTQHVLFFTDASFIIALGVCSDVWTVIKNALCIHLSEIGIYIPGPPQFQQSLSHQWNVTSPLYRVI